MKEEMETIVFEIISNAGCVKGICYEALDLAIESKIDEAYKKLDEANEYLLKAHEIQTNLIQKEVNGEKVELSVLFVHAQDHLMSCIEIKNLVSKLIKLCEVKNNG